jgi:ABC-type phosphate transport system substrate-binding protein
MKHPRSIFLATFILLTAVQCSAHHLAVVVDKSNNVGNITSGHLTRILRSEVKKWPDGKSIVLVLHKNLSEENLTLQRLTNMSAAELKTLFAAHKDSILAVDSDSDVIKAVASTPGAIGLVEVHSVDEGINVVKVDGKLPMEDGYLPH